MGNKIHKLAMANWLLGDLERRTESVLKVRADSSTKATPQTDARVEFQKGNILVSTLLILITMNLLGAGLLQTSTKESTTATFKTVNAQVFQITDTCTHDVMTWFETLSATPVTLTPVSQSNINFMLTGSETTKQLNKLTGYSYGCTITYLTSKNVSSGSGLGTEVSSTGSEYGGTGGQTLKDYYQIVSTGAGPNNSVKVVNTIISVSY